MQVVLSCWGIKGRYGKAPLPATLTGTDRQGQRSTLRFLPLGRVAVTHRPHESRDTDGTVQIRFDHSESDGVVRAQVDAVRRRGKEVRAVKQRGSVIGGYKLGFRLPGYAWPRFAARVGLAVGALAAEESWLHTETAQHLREILCSPTADSPFRLYMAPTDPPEGHAINGALLPPEHFLWTSHTPAGLASVCIVLFGDWFMPVPLAMHADEGKLVRDHAWLIDPVRAAVTTSGKLTDIVAVGAQRARQRLLRSSRLWKIRLMRASPRLASFPGNSRNSRPARSSSRNIR